VIRGGIAAKNVKQLMLNELVPLSPTGPVTIFNKDESCAPNNRRYQSHIRQEISLQTSKSLREDSRFLISFKCHKPFADSEVHD